MPGLAFGWLEVLEIEGSRFERDETVRSTVCTYQIKFCANASAECHAQALKGKGDRKGRPVPSLLARSLVLRRSRRRGFATAHLDVVDYFHPASIAFRDLLGSLLLVFGSGSGQLDLIPDHADVDVCAG